MCCVLLKQIRIGVSARHESAYESSRRKDTLAGQGAKIRLLMEKRQSRALPRIKQHTQQLTNKSRSERERAADYDQVLDQDSKHSTEA